MPACSDQLQSFQARVAVFADDDVVVHGNAERSGDIDDRLGHMDIRTRRRRIAGGVVMHRIIAVADNSSARLITSRG